MPSWVTARNSNKRKDVGQATEAKMFNITGNRWTSNRADSEHRWPGFVPDSGILHSARSASSTAHLWPPSSFRLFGTGCCILRVGGMGHLTSNAWPQPRRGEERLQMENVHFFFLSSVQQNKQEIICVFRWQNKTFPPYWGILSGDKTGSHLLELTLLCVNSPLTLSFSVPAQSVSSGQLGEQLAGADPLIVFLRAAGHKTNTS